MRRIALIVVLIAVLVAAGLSTMAAVAQTPTLSVNVDSTMTFLRATGSKWTPAQLVSLYWDVEDNAHLVAIAKPLKNGAIAATVPLDGTTPGYHEIIGVQGATKVSKQFWLPAAEPPDDRTWGVLQGIDTEVANIEAKLDNKKWGLQEIKAEVASIERLLRGINCDSGQIEIGKNGEKSREWGKSGKPCSAQVTLDTRDLESGDRVKVRVAAAGDGWAKLFEVNISDEAALTFEFAAEEFQVIVVNGDGTGKDTVRYTVMWKPCPSECDSGEMEIAKNGEKSKEWGESGRPCSAHVTLDTRDLEKGDRVKVRVSAGGDGGLKLLEANTTAAGDGWAKLFEVNISDEAALTFEFAAEEFQVIVVNGDGTGKDTVRYTVVWEPCPSGVK